MARPSPTELAYSAVVLLRTTSWPRGVRVLVTPQGIFGGLLDYFSTPRNRARSEAWQTKTARAVGLLHDYLVAVSAGTSVTQRGPSGSVGDGAVAGHAQKGAQNVGSFSVSQRSASPRQQLSGFVEALTNGTIRPDGTDPSDLYWRPLPIQAVRNVMGSINSFADYCVDEYGATPVNPLVSADFGHRVAALHRLDRTNRHSLLKHLGPGLSARAGAGLMRAVPAPRAPRVSPARPPYFPFEHFERLLTHGFKTRAHQRDPMKPWETWNLRDILIAVLQRHGGIRASEAFHLFVTDVREDPRNPGSAEVRLYHPEMGRFSHFDPLTRGLVHPTRADYLRSAYQRLPRTRIPGAEHAGWKDLMLDTGAPDYYTTVRWFPSEWGTVFWQLYSLYVRHVLPRGLTHPYLFVTLDHGPHHGKPYRLGAYHRNLAAAVERIGLSVDKGQGTTSHGLRHAYGQSLEIAGVGTKIIQSCMHHKSPVSQEVYTRPERERVRAELEAARSRLSGPLAANLQPTGLPMLPARDPEETLLPLAGFPASSRGTSSGSTLPSGAA